MLAWYFCFFTLVFRMSSTASSIAAPTKLSKVICLVMTIPTLGHEVLVRGEKRCNQIVVS